jgi:hypothetical protein
MSQTGDIKLKIRDLLQDLVNNDTLADVIVLNKPTAIFSLQTEKFPVAVLANNSFSGERATNRDNEVTHIFEILVIEKTDNIDTDTYLEDLSETIRKKFADNETLGGLSIAIEPSSSQVGPISEADYSMTVFLITLKIRAIETLN